MYVCIYIYIYNFSVSEYTENNFSVCFSSRTQGQYICICMYLEYPTHLAADAKLKQCVSIRQHTSAYVSIRQHTSAHLSTPQHTSTSAYIYLSIHQHTSAYLSIPQLLLKGNWLFWSHIWTRLSFMRRFSDCKYSNPFLIFVCLHASAMRQLPTY